MSQADRPALSDAERPASPAPLRLRELRPDAVAAALERDPRLIIPVGTCEQHGPHLPLGTATIIAERVADDCSARFGILRAPTVEYGVNVATERGLPGNASLRKKTLHRALNDLLAAWEAGGVREFILLSAHEHDPHQEAMATVITKSSRVRVVNVFEVDIGPLLDGQGGHMHADEADTSLLLYLAPGLVRMELARDHMVSRETVRRYRRGALRVFRESGGAIGRPTLATAEKGCTLYEYMLQRIIDRVFLTPTPQ